ncbi:MAG: hypothetical protein ACLGPM_06535 [Acidobacteriota bacterium]
MNKSTRQPERQNDKGKNEQQENRQERDIEIPAIRHVGPTLESDPKYLEAIGSGESTPEAQIAEEAARTEPDVRGLMREGIDPTTGRQREVTRPEPLKTRLPGDTSSDPHTDVGPDNAINLQQESDIRSPKRNAA